MTIQELILDETEQTEQVRALELGRKFYTIDNHGQPRDVGRIQVISYDGDKAKSAQFTSGDGSGQFSLGNVGKGYRPIDHYRVTNPLLEAGFQPEMVKHNRGGAGVFGLFSHPDTMLPDTIQWDMEIYDDNHKISKRGLKLSIAAWVDARMGKSIRLAVGYFRTVCYNGLVSSILGMGSLRMTAQEFTPRKVAQLAEEALSTSGALVLQSFTPAVLEWPFALMEKYSNDPTILDSLPAFARDPFSASVATMPAWALDEMMYQTNLILDHGQDITTLDVLNLLTNVSNQGESNQIYFRLESFAEAFTKLMAVSAFKLDVDFPHIVVSR